MSLYSDEYDVLETVDDVGEHVTNQRPEDGEDNDNDDCYEDEDECIFNQALAFFLWSVQHYDYSLNDLNDKPFMWLEITVACFRD